MKKHKFKTSKGLFVILEQGTKPIKYKCAYTFNTLTNEQAKEIVGNELEIAFNELDMLYFMLDDAILTKFNNPIIYKL